MIAFGITDKGMVREQNQDAYRLFLGEDGESAVAVLCDGMGGAQAGEIASSLTAETFLDYARKALGQETPPLASDVARESAAYANLQVYDRAYRDESCRGMGTTLVAAVINGGDAAVVNVGDSRCYWLAEGQLQQVTRDHSWVQDLVDQGKLSQGEARSHPRKNLITRAVGLQRRIRCDVFRLDLREGDVLLLCSDGLSNQVSEEEIAGMLQSTGASQETCDGLLALAMRRGAPDNVTVALLQR